MTCVLSCSARPSLPCGLSLASAGGGCSPVAAAVLRLIAVVAAPAAGPGLERHGLSGSGAFGLLPDQGLDLCPRHWQADSYTL